MLFKKMITATALACSIFISACNEDKEPTAPGENPAMIPKKDSVISNPPQAAVPNEDSIKNFMYSTPGTYGWKTISNDTMYDFFKDGRLHIQGADGEATMWEGTWTLNGDQLTLENKSLKTIEIVTVKPDGQNLLLGNRSYTRYSAK